MTTAENTAPAPHTAEPQWASGGPGKSAYTDYRWECGCGHRYDNPGSTGVNVLHYAHLATVRHADAIRTRADRAVLQLRAARDLLAAHDLDADVLITTIDGRARRAIAAGLRAYEYAAIDGVADRITRVSNRLTGTRVTGRGRLASIETTSGGDPDGDRLMNLVLNLHAIETDRPDSDFFTV